MTDLIAGVAIGVSLVLFMPLVFSMLRSFYWAGADAADLLKNGELMPGRSRANWLWILPRTFLKSFGTTLASEVRGIKRVS